MIKKIFILFALVLGLATTAPLAYMLYNLEKGITITPDKWNGFEFWVACVFGAAILLALAFQIAECLRKD